MCIGLWTLDHPDYALILCTNRDEFLSRPTEDAKFHSFGHDTAGHHNILSGIDTRAGGTWFGLNRAGRITLLTNIAEPPPAGHISSRGHLTSSFLQSDSSLPLIKEEEDEDEDVRIQRLLNVPRDAKISGFNMLLLAPRPIRPQVQIPNGPPLSPSPYLVFDGLIATNGGAGGPITLRTLTEDERRSGGLSNGIDGKGGNEWMKVMLGTQSLDTLLGDWMSREVEETEIVNTLFEILTWRPPEPILEHSDLRNTILVEPILINNAPDGDPDLSGTRLSTVLLIRRDGQVRFIERDVYRLDNDRGITTRDPAAERLFRFTLDIDRTTHALPTD